MLNILPSRKTTNTTTSYLPLLSTMAPASIVSVITATSDITIEYNYTTKMFNLDKLISSAKRICPKIKNDFETNETVSTVAQDLLSKKDVQMMMKTATDETFCRFDMFTYHVFKYLSDSDQVYEIMEHAATMAAHTHPSMANLKGVSKVDSPTKGCFALLYSRCTQPVGCPELKVSMKTGTYNTLVRFVQSAMGKTNIGTYSVPILNAQMMYFPDATGPETVMKIAHDKYFKLAMEDLEKEFDQEMTEAGYQNEEAKVEADEENTEEKEEGWTKDDTSNDTPSKDKEKAKKPKAPKRNLVPVENLIAKYKTLLTNQSKKKSILKHIEETNGKIEQHGIDHEFTDKEWKDTYYSITKVDNTFAGHKDMIYNLESVDRLLQARLVATDAKIKELKSDLASFKHLFMAYHFKTAPTWSNIGEAYKAALAKKAKKAPTNVDEVGDSDIGETSAKTVAPKGSKAVSSITITSKVLMGWHPSKIYDLINKAVKEYNETYKVRAIRPVNMYTSETDGFKYTDAELFERQCSAIVDLQFPVPQRNENVVGFSTYKKTYLPLLAKCKPLEGCLDSKFAIDLRNLDSTETVDAKTKKPKTKFVPANIAKQIALAMKNPTYVDLTERKPAPKKATKKDTSTSPKVESKSDNEEEEEEEVEEEDEEEVEEEEEEDF